MTETISGDCFRITFVWCQSALPQARQLGHPSHPALLVSKLQETCHPSLPSGQTEYSPSCWFWRNFIVFDLSHWREWTRKFQLPPCLNLGWLSRLSKHIPLTQSYLFEWHQVALCTSLISELLWNIMKYSISRECIGACDYSMIPLLVLSCNLRALAWPVPMLLVRDSKERHVPFEASLNFVEYWLLGSLDITGSHMQQEEV